MLWREKVSYRIASIVDVIMIDTKIVVQDGIGVYISGTLVFFS
jgi:hypothetical protein